MLFRYSRSCVAMLAVCLFASCSPPTADNPLNFVAARGYNLLITIRPAQIWNSDLMQELLDEVSERTIERIQADWDEAFGMRIEESSFLFGAIGLPKSLTGSRVRDAIFIGGGPYRDEKVRELCGRLFDPSDFVERDYDGGTYYTLSPPRGDYTFAYAMTDKAAVIGLENSVTNSLDVLSGREKGILLSKKYSENSSLINAGAGITALVWDVSDLLEMGTSFLRMEQRENLPPDTTAAINSVEAMGVSVEFSSDLVLTFRGRFKDAEAAATAGAFVEETLKNLTGEEDLRELMILFAGVAEKEDDLVEIIEAISVVTDGPVLTIQQTIPGDSPFLENLRDAFFGAAEAEQGRSRGKTGSGGGGSEEPEPVNSAAAPEFY